MKTQFKLPLILLTVCAVFLCLNLMSSRVEENHEVLKRIHMLKAHQGLGVIGPVPFETLESPRFSERQYRHVQTIDVEPSVEPEGDNETEVTGPYLDDAWRDWKSNCGKNWDDAKEEATRRARWEKSFRAQEDINDGSSTFSVAQNCQMDMTQEEIRESYFGLDKTPSTAEPLETVEETQQEQEHIHDQSLPQYVLWKNVIDLPVREQRCGDCWANAGATTLESLYQIIGNNYTKFSVQEDINCVFPSDGCQGGDYPQVFQYAQANGAVVEADQPYVGTYASGDSCASDPKYKKNNKKFVSGFKRANDCNGLKAAVLKAPVSIGIYANRGFMGTTSSIYPFELTTSPLNHAVTLVGYTPEAWIIQNSWGKAAHYNGFVRVAMGNTLGVCSDVAWPTTTSKYNKVPSTAAFDFQTVFAPAAPAGGTTPAGGSTVAGLNLNLLIGTKFAIGYASNPLTPLRNTKGETASSLSPNYWYIPEGRMKTDFNFRQLSITFINQNNNPIEFIIEGSDETLNVVNLTGWKFGRCGATSYVDATLKQWCNGQSDKIFWLFNAQLGNAIALVWYKP